MKNLQKSSMILWTIVIVVAIVLVIAGYLYMGSTSVQTQQALINASTSVSVPANTGSSNTTTTSGFYITPTSAMASDTITAYNSGNNAEYAELCFDNTNQSPQACSGMAVFSNFDVHNPLETFTIPSTVSVGDHSVQVCGFGDQGPTDETGNCTQKVELTITSSPTSTVITSSTSTQDVSNIMTYTNSYPDFDLSFQYPSSLNVDKSYGGIVNPPQVYVTPLTTSSSSIDINGCYKTITSIGILASGTQTIINNIHFCQTNDMSPGAGTLEGDYYFTTYEDGYYVTIGYPIGTLNGCGVYYGQTGYQECEDFWNNYNTLVIQPLDQSAGTLTFTAPQKGITFTASPSFGNSPLAVMFTATIDSSLYGRGPFVINFGAGPENHAAVGLTGTVGSTIQTTEPETYTYTSHGIYTASISKGGCAPDLSLGGPTPQSNQGSCNLGATIDTVTVTVK